jgi:hypothetical protein
MISVVCAGNRNSVASLLMEWKDLASKQRLFLLGILYNYDSISLLAFSVSVAKKIGIHHLSLWATADILRYAGCGPASPERDQKHIVNIIIL